MKGYLRLIQYCVEFMPREGIDLIPKGLNLRGIYVLFRKKRKFYNVVYVGIAAKYTATIRGRLKSHAEDKEKSGWTHFSFYKVWPNVTEQEIRELEGLFLHIYRKDEQAQKYNKVKHFGPLTKIRIGNIRKQRDILENLEMSIKKFPKRHKIK